MKKFYVDLSIRPPVKDSDIDRYCKLLGMLKYKCIAFTHVYGLDSLSEFLIKVSRFSEKCDNISVIKRIHIIADNVSSVKKILREDFLREFSLISVETNNLETLRWASRDKRIRVIRVNKFTSRHIDSSEQRLLLESNSVLEITLRNLLYRRRIEWLRVVIDSLRKSVAYDIPVVISSDATSWLEFFPPHVGISLCDLADIPPGMCLSFLSTIPLSLTSCGR